MIMSHYLVHKDITREDMFYETKGEWKLRPTPTIVQILHERTVLKYMRSYPKEDRVFIYNRGEGIYREFNNNELMVLVSQMFKQSSLILPSVGALEDITKYMKFNVKAYVGLPIRDKDHLVFTNGMLNIQNGVFGEWNPEIFATILLPYEFDPGARAPEFMRFMKEFTSYKEDREEFMRAWFWAVIRSWVQGQVFLYLLGPGGTGKSTLIVILTALVGEENTITTTLRELSTSPFEAANLQGKKLIVIGDNENYKGDLSILKQIVGQDRLKGRLKYKMKNYDLFVEGMVVIVGNYPLASRDTMDALFRRMLQFPADNICQRNQMEDLIYHTPNGWAGKLSGEFPGIFSWAYHMDTGVAQKYLRNTKDMVPSMVESLEESRETMNPMLAWVKEELEVGEGSYVGFRMKRDLKGLLELSRRRTLYPTYRIWAENRDIRPLGHRRFTRELSFALQSLGYKVNKVRKEEGMYIEGVRVRNEVYNRDRSYGAPLVPSELEEPAYTTKGPELSATPDVPTRVDPVQLVGPKGYVAPLKSQQHEALIMDLYERYYEKLAKTPLKSELQNISKTLILDKVELVEGCLRTPNPSVAYKEKMESVIERGLKNLKYFGAIPYKYKPLGVSPRILPVNYGSGINAAKSIIREGVYTHLAQRLSDRGKIILDLDLTSCFTSILIGLYPYDLQVLQGAIEGIGLWKHIYKEFEANGKASVYDKPSVKICTYSSFFLGGNKAMMQGILDSFRKSLDLNERDFKSFPDYESFHTIAREVTAEMQNSSVVTDFRAISSRIQEEYMDDYLIGPTGHAYLVTKEQFQSAYPNYLQSFEFALLAHSTLRVIEAYPEVEILGHFHDGNVIVIPQDQQMEILELFQKTLEELGYALGLRYKQKIEIKKTYKYNPEI